MLENYSCPKTHYYYSLDYIYKYNLKSIYNVLKINKINYKIIFLSKTNLLKKQKQQTYNFLLRIFFILYIYEFIYYDFLYMILLLLVILFI